MKNTAVISGVGMVPFAKPGASAPYYQMGAEAARQALADAGLDYAKVEQAYVGYVYGDSTCGQRALYPIGMTGIPVINVNNNCSTGSTALFLARQAVESGAADCVIALGFEQMKPGALGSSTTTGRPPSNPLTGSARTWWDSPRCRWRSAILAARAWRTWTSTAPRRRPSPKYALRRAGMPRATRWRCSARK